MYTFTEHIKHITRHLKKKIIGWSILLIIIVISGTNAFAAENKPNNTDKNKACEPEQIEIETDVTASPLEKYLVTTSTITKEEIATQPGKTLIDVLKTLTGVIPFDEAGRKGKTDLTIRGFGINYIKVYIDGVPLNTSNERTVDFGLIPLEIVEKIEVIRGPAPVLYGSDSMGGIINIITKTGRNNKGFFLSTTGGSFGTFQGSGAVGMKSGNFGFYALAKRSSTNGWSPHMQSILNNLYLKADLEIAKMTNLSFLVLHTKGNRECQNSLNPDGSLLKQTGGFWSNSYNWEYPTMSQQLYQVKIERPCDGNHIGFCLNTYYKRYDDTLRAYVDPGSPIKPPANSPLEYYGAGRWNYSYWNSYDFGGNYYLTIPANRHMISAGASTERPVFRDTRTGRSFPGDFPGSLSLPYEQWDQNYMNPWMSSRYTSYYVQDKVDLSKEFVFCLGLRRDTNSRSSAANIAVGNLVWTHDKNSLRLAVGSSNRFPSLSELTGKGGNPNLKAEIGTNYEIGFRHTNPRIVDIEASVYYSTVNGLIQPSDPADVFSTKINLNNVKIAGGEFNLVKPWKNFQGRIGYSYDHRNLPTALVTKNWAELPSHSGIVELKYEKEKSICWTVQGLAYSSRKTGDPVTPRLPGYGVVNVLFAYPNFKYTPCDSKPWNLEVGVNNIFNKKYQVILGFPEPGRYITGTVNYKF